MRLLVTGGCGFIGSNFIRYVLDHYQPEMITNVDALTYAGSIESSAAFSSSFGDRYEFFKADIADAERMDEVLANHSYFAVVNFAAESHVDRSIGSPENFIHTNVVGTTTLLDAARRRGVKRFVQVSTDEVYGSLPDRGRFTERCPLNPSSPYSASKAAADLLVLAAYKTYGQDVVVTRCSNNYGPYQHPEKLIPLMILHALSDRSLPVYGDGLNVRDWIHVEDHCAAVFDVLMEGRAGEVYNVGADTERKNLEVIRSILSHLGKGEELIRFVPDRPGHDRRYAIDSSKLRSEIGWKPLYDFETGLQQTIDWYRRNAW
ncbi:MAG TPA: dTDP-glucose 4,6-dehydratase [Chthoniobacterales bacterium]|jgi:dTDP-glucose 4,6-dehydratase|nr:dTDP-glucose 4,6-dehydratase [Chthoniobacterales bacterium]